VCVTSRNNRTGQGGLQLSRLKREHVAARLIEIWVMGRNSAEVMKVKHRKETLYYREKPAA
jgi:hypothetical protein